MFNRLSVGTPAGLPLWRERAAIQLTIRGGSRSQLLVSQRLLNVSIPNQLDELASLDNDDGRDRQAQG
jgi:hypothetical protein